ncbi:DUF389 domain-containing protein [Sphingobacterium hotanense]|uniref:DUF389 domain-containing protein n=1 Tax=Sphingobacterium hotanense TaxID=649196 RepID=UPI0021A26779|nr:DUF389 domain-containing protein [Sphingobacterium hotanense]MCT1526169.1 DUF389 domain-containing protein [Sphingobacterium hotanense]
MIKLLRSFNLHYGEESREVVLENVKSNISFKGANLWILACAIVVASVGLNVNSTAVIIGAMLISPLMGPIVGAGFALGTYDFDLLKKSAKNLGVATLVSLFVSFLYFLLSPFKETQSELLARTAPNIYDVLIAFFGGLVGGIAITRKEKGNPIPGVAIATALMPPLCTAGYGLAIGNFAYFSGAIYLYTINCFFICISTLFIVKLLKYPKIKFVDAQREKRITRTITVLLIIMLVPSFYLAYSLLQERKFTQNVSTFIQNEFAAKGYTVIYERTQFNSREKRIELAFLAKRFSDSELKDLNDRLGNYNLDNTKLLIRQDSVDLKKDILAEINKQSQHVSEKDITIQNLRNELAAYTFTDKALIEEITTLFPQVSPFSIGKQNVYFNKDSSHLQTILMIDGKNKLNEGDLNRLESWLKVKLKSDAVSVIARDN